MKVLITGSVWNGKRFLVGVEDLDELSANSLISSKHAKPYIEEVGEPVVKETSPQDVLPEEKEIVPEQPKRKKK